MFVNILPIQSLIDHFLDDVHFMLVVVFLENALHLLNLVVLVGHLLSNQVDVLEGFVRVEQQELISIVVWEEGLVAFNQILQFDLQSVVQTQRLVFILVDL